MSVNNILDLRCNMYFLMDLLTADLFCFIVELLKNFDKYGTFRNCLNLYADLEYCWQCKSVSLVHELGMHSKSIQYGDFKCSWYFVTVLDRSRGVFTQLFT